MLENFPESRYRHCYSVGKKMYQYGKEKLGMTEKKALNMFVLGNLHDIGYEFNPDSIEHAKVIGSALFASYSYSDAIRDHSTLVDDEYLTLELKLLYFGDATVDGNGNWVTYQERLDDLIARHGADSKVVSDTREIIAKLQEWGFDDTL